MILEPYCVRLERNAWRVAHDIALRIDDAPVLPDYIKAFVTEREEEAFFFFNKTQLIMITWRHLKVKKKNMSPAIIILLKFVAM